MFTSVVIGFALGFLCNIVYIGLKAFQQLNVMHDKYLWVFPISLAMALCETFTTKLIVSNTFWIFLPLGIGGGLGCIVSMKLHEIMRSGK